MIIVEDSVDDLKNIPELAAVSCPQNCEHDVQMVFQPLLAYANRGNLNRGFSQLQRIINDSEEYRL